MNGPRVLRVLTGMVALAWLAELVLGRWAAERLARSAGSLLQRIGHGMVQDGAGFLRHRLAEALLLVTVAVVLGWALVGLERCWRPLGWYRRWGWAALAAAGLVSLNLWLAAATRTALFWMLMYAGQTTHHQVPWHFKQILMAESTDRPQAVLMGNSQTPAQVDVPQLNRALGGQLTATDQSWPGSRAYEILLAQRHLSGRDCDYVICYLSEFAFYSPSPGEVVPHLFGWRDVPEFVRLGAWAQVSWEGAFCGLLGDLLPWFRHREALAGRLLGGGLVRLRQQAHGDALVEDLDQRAREMAATFHLSPYSDFQMRAAEEWISRCERQGCRVILLSGQVSPLLSRRLDPALRRHLTDFYRQLARRHPSLIVVEESALSAQSPADYVDLTHANAAARERFTQHLAGLLRTILAAQKDGPAPQPGGAR